MVDRYRKGGIWALQEDISTTGEWVQYSDYERLEKALRQIADDEDCPGLMFQDVAAIALGCTCTDYDRQKLMIGMDCPFHSPASGGVES